MILIAPTAQNEWGRLEAALASASAEEVSAESERKNAPTTVDRSRRIPVRGMILNSRIPFLDRYGINHVGLEELVTDIRAAQSDPDVDRIVLEVDSPGGVAGNPLVRAAAAVGESAKPVIAEVGEMAASAAYWIASQASEIRLLGPASMVGSIGVVVSYHTHPSLVSITSTDAPKKRPDVTTDRGKADVRELLDQLHALFRNAVAAGRGVSTADVDEKFGQGGMLLASEAIAVGMADSMIMDSAHTPARVTMHEMLTLDTLKSDHPDVFKAALELGATRERSRVNGHLAMAKASGATKEAIEHIESGIDPDDSGVWAVHKAAKLASLELSDRLADNPPETSVTKSDPNDAQTQKNLAILAEELGD